MDSVENPVDAGDVSSEASSEPFEAVDGVDIPVDAPIDVSLPIDEFPTDLPRRRVAPARKVSRQPSYRQLRHAVHRCEDCMVNHHSDPHSPLALPGRFERRVAGESVMLLCVEHVQHWRDRDGLPPLPPLRTGRLAD